MESNFMQEVTGVRLFDEKRIFLEEEEVEKIKETVKFINHKNENEKEVSEIYFDASIPVGEQGEQFVLALEKQKNKKNYLLIRKNKVAGFQSEKIAKLSKSQYADIIKGSVEWMKESKKVLINEFYCKMKIFQYKISKIIKGYQREIYLQCEQVLITLNETLKEYTPGGVLDSSSQKGRVYVTVRSNVKRDDRAREHEIIDRLIGTKE